MATRRVFSLTLNPARFGERPANRWTYIFADTHSSPSVLQYTLLHSLSWRRMRKIMEQCKYYACVCFLQLRGNVDQAARSALANASSSRPAPPRLPPLSEPRSQTEVNGCSHEQMSDAFCCGRRARRGGGEREKHGDARGGGELKGGKIRAEKTQRPPTEREGGWDQRYGLHFITTYSLEVPPKCRLVAVLWSTFSSNADLTCTFDPAPVI